MKSRIERKDAREEFQCNTCGETWVHGGDNQCPFCGSTDTGPVETEENTKGGC